MRKIRSQLKKKLCRVAKMASTVYETEICGAATGSRTHLEEYVKGKVDDWVEQVVKLAEFAVVNPQASSNAALTFGLKHR